MRRLFALRRDGGASLVEFAIIAPILFLVVFGIIDFGWTFAQHQDVRHGAREAARLTVVDWGTVAEIKVETDARTGSVDLAPVEDHVRIGAADINNSGDLDAGDPIVIRVCDDSDSLTGFFSFLNIELKSVVAMRMEREFTPNLVEADLDVWLPSPNDADDVKAHPGLDCQ